MIYPRNYFLFVIYPWAARYSAKIFHCLIYFHFISEFKNISSHQRYEPKIGSFSPHWDAQQHLRRRAPHPDPIRVLLSLGELLLLLLQLQRVEPSQPLIELGHDRRLLLPPLLGDGVRRHRPDLIKRHLDGKYAGSRSSIYFPQFPDLMGFFY